MKALDGLRVVDMSRLLPGTFCTTLLADHGAEVTMVEAPRFRRGTVIGKVPMVRRNKRHLSVDVSVPEGREVFARLLERSDVLVEGFRPGVTTKLGIDYPTLAPRHRRLIYCSLTGYGQTGPLAARAGHDLNFMAIAGILDLNRDNQGVPIAPHFQISHVVGGLYAALGILLALEARSKTGLGQHIDLSIADGLLSVLAIPISAAKSGRTLPGGETGNGHHGFPCYRVYSTRDGKHLSVGPLEPHLWRKLCHKLGFPEYADFQYDADHKDEIAGRFERLFRSRTLDEWLAFFNDADDCVAPVNCVAALTDERQFAVRNMIVLDSEGVPQPGLMPKLSATPGSIGSEGFEFGEHTREILGEMGYSREQIDRLAAQGVVWAADHQRPS